MLLTWVWEGSNIHLARRKQRASAARPRRSTMSNLNRATVSALKGETIARGDDRKAITGNGPLVARYNSPNHGLRVTKVEVKR